LPSHRQTQNQLPSIVKVATSVAQRIAEAAGDSNSAAGEVDFEQLMNAPCYIYFEEHHPTEAYAAFKSNQLQPRLFNPRVAN